MKKISDIMNTKINKRMICAVFIAAVLLSVLGVIDLILNPGSDFEVLPDFPCYSYPQTTLSMYVVSEEPVSEKTSALVNEAFNKITKTKFDTKVVLHFLTYDEYYSTIENIIEEYEKYVELGEEAEKEFRKARKAARDNGVATDKAWEDSWFAEHPDYIEFRETEEFTGKDTAAEENVMVTVEGAEDYAIAEPKYPDEKKYQIDIIWIDSYDRYKEYIDNEWLERLDDELSGASKKLKEYISPTVLQWVKWSSQGTYAIPNNAAVGEYTYLLLNKKYMDKYSYTADDIPDVFSENSKFGKYISDIMRYEPSVAPILGDLPLTNVLYWSPNTETGKINGNVFSLIGCTYDKDRNFYFEASDNAPAAMTNLFADNNYTAQLTEIQALKDSGAIVNESEAKGKEYAARVINGGYELREQFGDEYYVNILEYPRINEDDVFSSMFAVSTHSRSLYRSMEILSCLDTEPELRNILQYGVQGIHYELTKEGYVKRLNRDYIMNVMNTGNPLIAYPEEGASPDIWENAKKQTLDLKTSPLACFRIPQTALGKEDGKDEKNESTSDDALLNLSHISEIETCSRLIEEKLKSVKNSVELKNVISEAAALAKDAIEYQASSEIKDSLYGIYLRWLNDSTLFNPTISEVYTYFDNNYQVKNPQPHYIVFKTKDEFSYFLNSYYDAYYAKQYINKYPENGFIVAVLTVDPFYNLTFTSEVNVKGNTIYINLDAKYKVPARNKTCGNITYVPLDGNYNDQKIVIVESYSEDTE